MSSCAATRPFLISRRGRAWNELHGNKPRPNRAPRTPAGPTPLTAPCLAGTRSRLSPGSLPACSPASLGPGAGLPLSRSWPRGNPPPGPGAGGEPLLPLGLGAPAARPRYLLGAAHPREPSRAIPQPRLRPRRFPRPRARGASRKSHTIREPQPLPMSASPPPSAGTPFASGWGLLRPDEPM
ncbi:hypothetical protein KIL84_003220 [Mauremys mutica]|uniref:Uncharacterized protein n=1 Tax=Mauremys mutica TaxID=74926 RepID=A0A9D3WTC0_9SAUR|nr:hypothetical protein KIL84_003220 [Mauremys mutica]